ncbi:MAG: hypothetical protein DWQ31_16040 [Planctomycetota bacterium]|nr:MAG: hypothetical protein DWQ31_16040 [Planctomycetota bacterium]REJ89097.1 MAG: hypothetical protein DWQ35_18715 [Planctomycetota bacterium]
MGTLTITTALLAISAAGETVLLDFQAPWCGPCRMMDRHVEQLAETGYPIRKIDTDQDQDTAARYGVQSIPCFVLLVDGQERGRVVGATTRERLEQLFRDAGVRPVTKRGAVTRGQSPDGRFFGRGRGRSPASSPPSGSPMGLHIEEGQLVSAASTEQPRTPPPPRPSVAPAAAPRTNPGAMAAVAPPAQPAANRPTPPVAPASFVAQEPPTDLRTAGNPQTDLATQLLASSVRLNVGDAAGASHGSGTIIDSIPPRDGKPGEALILTCAHIFRDSQGKGPIRVDLFDRGQPQSSRGYLVRYDLEQDVALVSIYTNRVIPAVKMAGDSYRPQRGDATMSIGCGGGRQPTVQQGQVINVEGFSEVGKIQVSGQPEIGRSGGGLFNADGHLVGVCNFADPTDAAGLYANLSATKQLFVDAGLAAIYQDASVPSSIDRAPATLASTAATPPPMPNMPGSGVQPAAAAASLPRQMEPVEGLSVTDREKELICIVRSESDPTAPAEVIVIDRASQELLQRIASERRQRQGAYPTSQHSPATTKHR